MTTPISPQYPHLTANKGVDWNGVNGQVLKDLETLAEQFKTTINLTSGKRTSAQSIALGESGNDPHTRGVAADATIGGRPIGSVLPRSAFGSVGLFSGNVAGFDKTKPGGFDPVHVQLADTSGVSSTQTTATSFFDAVLNILHLPTTKQNENVLIAQAEQEGTKARNNPLATTLHLPGSTTLAGNSAGVQEYGSVTQGEQATAQTLTGYPNIVAALKTGTPLAGGVTSGIKSDYARWSGGNQGYAADVFFKASTLGGAPSGLGNFGSFSPVGAAGDAASAINTAVNPIAWVDHLTGWVEKYAIRGLEIAGGAALIILAITILGFGIINTQPAKQAGGAIAKVAK